MMDCKSRATGVEFLELVVLGGIIISTVGLHAALAIGATLIVLAYAAGND